MRCCSLRARDGVVWREPNCLFVLVYAVLNGHQGNVWSQGISLEFIDVPLALARPVLAHGSFKGTFLRQKPTMNDKILCHFAVNFLVASWLLVLHGTGTILYSQYLRSA